MIEEIGLTYTNIVTYYFMSFQFEIDFQKD